MGGDQARVRPSARETAQNSWIISFSVRMSTAGEGFIEQHHRRPLGPGPGREKARLALTTGESPILGDRAKGQRSTRLQGGLSRTGALGRLAGGCGKQVSLRHKRPHSSPTLPTIHREVPIHALPSGWARRRGPLGCGRRPWPQRPAFDLGRCCLWRVHKTLTPLKQRRFASRPFMPTPARRGCWPELQGGTSWSRNDAVISRDA